MFFIDFCRKRVRLCSTQEQIYADLLMQTFALTKSECADLFEQNITLNVMHIQRYEIGIVTHELIF